MSRLLAPLVLLAAAAAVTAGCGGSSDNGGGGGTSSSPAAPAATTTTASDSGAAKGSGKSAEVRLQNIAFSPKTVKVKAGQEVEWENYDSVAHDVVATSGASFRSPTLRKDAKFSFTPTKAGTISYVCTFHPGMQAEIVVTQ
jgi:plastocyanin